jgi:hypothetical protein
MDFERIGRVIDYNALDPNNYSALELFRDLRKGIWSELNSGSDVDVYRRNLQRAYLDRMNYLMTENLNPQRSRKYYNVNQSDVRSIVRGELNVLKRQLERAKGSGVNTETVYHYEDCIARIEALFNKNK